MTTIIMEIAPNAEEIDHPPQRRRRKGMRNMLQLAT